MRWMKAKDGLSWSLHGADVFYVVAYILKNGNEYLLSLWDDEHKNFGKPIKLLTLEEAKSMGKLLVKLRYSEVLNGMAS
jgi:hypothetical protein